MKFHRNRAGHYTAIIGDKPVLRRYTVKQREDGFWTASVFCLADGPPLAETAHPRNCVTFFATMRRAMRQCDLWEEAVAYLA